MNIKKALPLVVLLSLAICLLLTAGCNGGEKAQATLSKETEKPIIAVTIVPEKSFVEAVCGDLAQVVVMVPPGYSPGNYEPTQQEMSRLSNASLYFAIGVPTEQANILPDLENIKIISLQNEVAAAYPDRTLASGGIDPHIWLSPKRAVVMVEAIAREMCELDVENSEIYTANAREYIDRLQELDREIAAVFDQLTTKKFIVFHPAFGYLADDYNLEMFALEEGGKEATPQRLKEMVDLARQEGIKSVFYQKEIDSSQSKAFAEEIEGRTVQLEPLAADYIGNLKLMAQTMSEAMQ